MIGRLVDAWTIAISCDDAVSEVIIQGAPTDWIRPPKLDAMLASQTARTIGKSEGRARGRRRLHSA
ncbi:MAG: hypothetical protein JWN59_494 [Sphingomonas bacterium]|nr:hypothetical protein [Sphingomonas bacterium]